MDCPFCSSEIADEANFCPHCGRGVAASRTGRAPTPAGPPDGTADADTARSAHDDETAAIGMHDTGEIPAADPGGAPTERVDRVSELTPDEQPEPTSEEAPTERVAGVTAGPRTGPMRRCPSCGAQNSARRALCGRCGVDLETGAAHRDRHAADAWDDEEPTSAGDGRSTKAVVAVVVVGALIGTVIGIIALTRIGDEPIADAPVFDEGVYGDVPMDLGVSSATASSTRDALDDRRFAAASTIDGESGTAWAAGDGDGVGETVALRLREPSWVDSVSIWVGDQHDEDTFRRSGRPTQVMLHVDGAPRFEVTLADRAGEQAVTFPDPVLGRTVVVEVLEVASGEGGEPAALSRVELRGWIALGADREG